MQERLKNALTAIGFCMLALVMTSVFATTVKAETNAELKNRSVLMLCSRIPWLKITEPVWKAEMWTQ